MRKLLYIAVVAAAAMVAACGGKESAIEKYWVDYYPETNGIKIAEVKAEDDIAPTSQNVSFYGNPHTNYLLDILDSGEYDVSVNLAVTLHCVSAYGQGACFYISPLICLYTIDSIEVRDSIYVDNNPDDSIYVGGALYVRDSIYPDDSLYVNRWDRVNTSKRVLYAGEMMNVTTLVNASGVADASAVTMSKSVVHAIDSQHVSVLDNNVLVPKRGVARVAFEIASDIHNARCYASNAAGGVGYAVIYIEPINEKIASAQMLLQN